MKAIDFACRFLSRVQDAGIRTSIDVVSDSSGHFAEKVIPALKYTDNAFMNEIEGSGVSGLEVRDADGKLIMENIRRTMEMILSWGIRERVILHCPEAGFCLNSDGVFTVVTSFYPVYTMASVIADGIDGVEVVNLVDNHVGCLHDYQMSPADRVTLESADVFVMNGAGAEPFLTAVLAQYTPPTVIDLSHGLPLIESGHIHDHGGGVSHHVAGVQTQKQQIQNKEQIAGHIHQQHLPLALE